MLDKLLVKVCGMRDADNIREVEQTGIDLMGFIFWPKSSRYVSERPTYLPTHCKRVGVFVDEDIERVKQTAEAYALDYIQLHGHETVDEISRLKTALADIPHTVTLIKAFNIATADDLRRTEDYEGVVDHFLFDTKGQSVGGNGEKFDWSVLRYYNGTATFLLSGGISPEDANRVNTFRHPKCIGIDVNSRFESSPGVKDVKTLRTFLEKVRK